MRTIILLAATSLCLSGCGVVQQQQLNSGMQTAQVAMNACDGNSPVHSSAWKQAFQHAEMNCPSGTAEKPLPPHMAVAANKCWSEGVKKFVVPIETKPSSLSRFLEEKERIAQSYQKGEIERNAANTLIQNASQRYEKEHTSFHKLAQCKNAALQQYVMPNYSHKGLLMSFMTRQSEVGLAIDNGQITPEQGDIEIQKAWAAFANNEQQTMMQIQAQNNAAAQRAFQNWTAMQQIENQRMESMNNVLMPQTRHTNCQAVGNNMVNCTTH